MKKTAKNRLTLAPTDLSNFLSCRHLTTLDADAALSGQRRPKREGPAIEALRQRGLAHEARYLEHLESQGLRVVTIGDEDDFSSAAREQGQRDTLAAMQGGVDVIFQAWLADKPFSGRADFIVKVDKPSQLGDWSYEVIDTKLARETKAGTILQLCVYSYLISRLQQMRPVHMHVISPGDDFTQHSYRLDDFSAYYRFVTQNIEAFLASLPETYPDLVPMCDLCVWWQQCDRRRRADDHLCYVAGISRTHIKVLRELGIDSLESLAKLDPVPKPGQGSQDTLIRLKRQAHIQLTGRETGKPYHELLEPFNEEHGFALLPEPTADDIFLDFEGNRFAEGPVTEYLTGFVQADDSGNSQYRALWATTPETERQAFETIVDLVTDVRSRNPRAHVYHYASYEPTALKQLVTRYATRESELDDLLRNDVFVDLHKIVRRSLIASVESYSIKQLEAHFRFERRQSLREATLGRRLLEVALDSGNAKEVFETHRQSIEDYNREDCESAQRLRDWLEALRSEVIAAGNSIPRPEDTEAKVNEKLAEIDKLVESIRGQLLDGIPADASERTPEQAASFLLAHTMAFHRREEKATWWEFFRLRDLEPEDCLDERRAVFGLTPHNIGEDLDLHTYSFPPQEIDARARDSAYDATGLSIGTVASLDLAARVISLRKKKTTRDVHPDSLVFHNYVSNESVRNSLLGFGKHVAEHGLADITPYRTATALLEAKASPLAGANEDLKRPDETTLDAARRLATGLDGHILAIQGPPGTGKTYTGGHIIRAAKSAGLTVGVTAVSHRVILNLIEGAIDIAADEGVRLRAVHKGSYDGDFSIDEESDYEDLRESIEAGAYDVIGGTAWCWSRPEFQNSVDLLIVDEAGQMALSNVLAVAPAARGLVLLGDPQQLEQPLQSSHPEGSEISALSHLLSGEKTMPADRGLFLADTYRLHPDIARFTSEVFYEGRVSSVSGLENQAILSRNGTALSAEGSGLRLLPVEHSGNQAQSPEEVARIAALVDELLANARWRDRNNAERDLLPEDILIVAPYNAQVSSLRASIPLLDSRIGTVDKFQGQEAPVVIYSMTSSTPEDVPRGMEFLYDPHRFNVATSRARALCILVGSRALFEPECRTPRQMQMANAFCRFLELATEIPS